MREAVCALEVLCAVRRGLRGLVLRDLWWLLGLVLVVVVVSSLLRRGECRWCGGHLGVCV